MIILNGKQYHALTKQRRNEYYRRAWETFRTDPVGPYLCNVLSMMLHNDGKCPFPGSVITAKEIVTLFFPEFVIQLGETLCWPDTASWNNHRANVLAQCIEETNAM